MDPDEEITPDEAYGWKKVTKLAKRTDNTAEKSPFRYADTLALFASGALTLTLPSAQQLTRVNRYQTALCRSVGLHHRQREADE